MSWLSTRSRIALGLIGLTTSLLLVASLFGFIPDRERAIRESRAAIAEVVAASASQWLHDGAINKGVAALRIAVDRNDDVLSAAIRDASGIIVVDTGPHRSHWQPMQGEYSTDAQIRLPILTIDGREWGMLELRFKPLRGEGISAVLTHPLVALLAFVNFAGFIAFYFFLSKVLTQLDPSKAIPGRVRSALDSLAEGLLIVDQGARIVLANRVFAGIVGRDADSFIGTSPNELPFSARGTQLRDADELPWMRALSSGEEVADTMLRLPDREGRIRTLKVNCSPVLGGDAEVSGVLVSFDDVTQLEEQGEELREAKDEAEAANRAKSEFLANMSHEIRTPMNAILGFADVLRRGYTRSDQDSRQHLDIIHSSGTHLLNLINDILDLSKVEAGRLEVEQREFAPFAVLQEVVDVLAVRATEKGLNLSLEAESAIPATIQSDSARLRQIATNLIGNAIKFTERGTVRVVVWFDDSNAGGSVLAIDVVDSGVGVAPEKHEAIFNPFEQADGSVNRRFGGTGLGLAISRRFARALGGDITLSSETGRGSTFQLRIATGVLDGVAMLDASDLVRESNTSLASESAWSSRWNFANARVLVVDDAAENRHLLRIVLGEAGLEIDDAEHGAVALERVAQQHYDLVLMDMQMPIMDGYTATRELRERGFKLPIIALTAHAMKGFENECMEAGCNGVATKPIVIDELLQQLSKYLQASRIDVDASTASEITSRDAVRANVAHENVTPLYSSLANDSRFAAIVSGFVERLALRLQQGETAYRARQWEALGEFAHWLKGSAGTVGFNPLTEPSTALEAAIYAGDALAIGRAWDEVCMLCRRIERGAQCTLEEVSASEVAHGPMSQLGGPTGVAEYSLPSVVTSSLAANPRFSALVERFVGNLRDRSAQLAAAKAAGEWQKVAEIAHWLKGSGGTLGFDVFTDVAAELEHTARSGDEEAAGNAVQHVLALVARIPDAQTQPHAVPDRPARAVNVG